MLRHATEAAVERRFNCLKFVRVSDWYDLIAYDSAVGTLLLKKTIYKTNETLFPLLRNVLNNKFQKIVNLPPLTLEEVAPEGGVPVLLIVRQCVDWLL